MSTRRQAYGIRRSAPRSDPRSGRLKKISKDRRCGHPLATGSRAVVRTIGSATAMSFGATHGHRRRSPLVVRRSKRVGGHITTRSTPRAGCEDSGTGSRDALGASARSTPSARADEVASKSPYAASYDAADSRGPSIEHSLDPRFRDGQRCSAESERLGFRSASSGLYWRAFRLR